jgi:hypothetical protein
VNPVGRPVQIIQGQLFDFPAAQPIVDQQQQDGVVTNLDRIIVRSGRFKCSVKLVHGGRSRNILERVETRQVDAVREIGSAPSSVRGVPKEAAQGAAEHMQGAAAPTPSRLRLQERVNLAEGHFAKRLHLRRQ